MDENNSATESGSTSTSFKPSMGLSNARKLKLYKAEKKLKQITKTLAAQTFAAKSGARSKSRTKPQAYNE